MAPPALSSDLFAIVGLLEMKRWMCVTDPVSAISAVAGVAKALDPNSKSMELGTSLWGAVLGPPAKALGLHYEKQVQRWSESEQTKHVLKLAASKSDASIPGSVAPRVAAAVLDAAQYSDDKFVAEYLSGVLASSRTPGGTDDRGVAWSALVGRLPADALKLHYIIYATLQRKMRGEDADVVTQWCQKYLVIRYFDMVPVWDFTSQEGVRRLVDAAYVLQREGLLDQLTHGGADHLTGYPYGQYVLPTGGDMLIVTTTVQGIQLFLQGHGYGGVWASAIAEADRTFHAAGAVEENLSKVPGTWLEELPRR
jgi:hypothetical protein